MYYFYVLFSIKDGMLYKGVTSDLGERYLELLRPEIADP